MNESHLGCSLNAATRDIDHYCHDTNKNESESNKWLDTRRVNRELFYEIKKNHEACRERKVKRKKGSLNTF